MERASGGARGDAGVWESRTEKVATRAGASRRAFRRGAMAIFAWVESALRVWLAAKHAPQISGPWAPPCPAATSADNANAPSGVCAIRSWAEDVTNARLVATSASQLYKCRLVMHAEPTGFANTRNMLRATKRPRLVHVCRWWKLGAAWKGWIWPGQTKRSRRAATRFSVSPNVPSAGGAGSLRHWRVRHVFVRLDADGLLYQPVFLHPSPEGAAADAQCSGRLAAAPTLGVQNIEKSLDLRSHAPVPGRAAGSLRPAISSALQ